MSYLTDCVMGKGRGQAGVCFGCAGELPKGRRRWCGDECRVEFEGNHYWNVARWVALRLAGDDRREVGARCARCGGDGRIPRGSCSCFASWPCPREGEPLYTYAGQVIDQHTPLHRQQFERSLEVNHIVPRNGRGYEPGCHHHQANLEVLCRGCHVQETRKQALGRRLAAALRIALGVREGRLILVPRPIRPMRPRRPPEAVPMPLWEVAS